MLNGKMLSDWLVQGMRGTWRERRSGQNREGEYGGEGCRRDREQLESRISDDNTEKLTGRVGSGSIRLRVNRLFFAVLSNLHCAQIKQIP